MMTNKAADIDQYIADFPDGIQKLLRQVRATIRKAAPGATEAIKYSMPAFVLHGNLVYFAAFKNHIGFYPVPKGDAAYQKELVGYKMGKGSIQFPYDRPMPLKLITKIVKLRIQDNLERRSLKEMVKKR